MNRLGLEFMGLHLINPFILASAPPTATPAMIERAFEAGWAGAVIKTLIDEPVRNFSNRFGINKIGSRVYGFKNIELVSELSPKEWFSGVVELKKKFPDRLIIGSIMADARDFDGWRRLALGCQEAGMDMVELNFSCPNGYPERVKDVPSVRMKRPQPILSETSRPIIGSPCPSFQSLLPMSPILLSLERNWQKQVQMLSVLSIQFHLRTHAIIDPETCKRCGKCVISCRDGGYQAIPALSDDACPYIDPEKCVGCSLCAHVCPFGAIHLIPRLG